MAPRRLQAHVRERVIESNLRFVVDGRRSIDNFDRALAARPELDDCYSGLGFCHYWRTARAGLLRHRSIGYQVERKYRIAEALNAQHRLAAAVGERRTRWTRYIH